MKFNFGASKFDYPPEGGYKGVCEAPKELVTQSSAGNKLFVLLQISCLLIENHSEPWILSVIFDLTYAFSLWLGSGAQTTSKTPKPNAPYAIIIEVSIFYLL